MSVPNLKDLKALALTCQKLGIHTFKCADFEFTFSHNVPQKQKRVKKDTKQFVPLVKDPNLTPEEETLSDEALLFWSTQGNEV